MKKEMEVKKIKTKKQKLKKKTKNGGGYIKKGFRPNGADKSKSWVITSKNVGWAENKARTEKDGWCAH